MTLTIAFGLIAMWLVGALWLAGSETIRWLDMRSRINRRLAASLKS